MGVGGAKGGLVAFVAFLPAISRGRAEQLPYCNERLRVPGEDSLLDRVIIVNNESLGGDDRELGAKLMGLFLTKLRMNDKLPDAIVFYNSGVRLLAKGSPVQHSIEGLIEDGVEILACGTCVNHYQMDEANLVGESSNMREIVDILLKANSVVTV